jgi:hypothetical protein
MTPISIVIAPRGTAQNQALQDWFAANGVTPNTVAARPIAYDTGVVTFRQFVLDGAGRKVLTPSSAAGKRRVTAFKSKPRRQAFTPPPELIRA